MSGLTYHLTVTNMNTGVMIINTTTTSTSHPIGLQNCSSYNASVAAFLQDHRGDAEVTMVRTPGGGELCEVQYIVQFQSSILFI